MRTISIHAAAAQLSRLVDESAAGEEIIVAGAGTPVARLVPLAPPSVERRVLARLAGRSSIPADFDDPLPASVLDAFEGR